MKLTQKDWLGIIKDFV